MACHSESEESFKITGEPVLTHPNDRSSTKSPSSSSFSPLAAVVSVDLDAHSTTNYNIEPPPLLDYEGPDCTGLGCDEAETAPLLIPAQNPKRPSPPPALEAEPSYHERRDKYHQQYDAMTSEFKKQLEIDVLSNPSPPPPMLLPFTLNLAAEDCVKNEEELKEEEDSDTLVANDLTIEGTSRKSFKILSEFGRSVARTVTAKLTKSADPFAVLPNEPLINIKKRGRKLKPFRGRYAKIREAERKKQKEEMEEFDKVRKGYMPMLEYHVQQMKRRCFMYGLAPEDINAISSTVLELVQKVVDPPVIQEKQKRMKKVFESTRDFLFRPRKKPQEDPEFYMETLTPRKSNIKPPVPQTISSPIALPTQLPLEIQTKNPKSPSKTVSAKGFDKSSYKSVPDKIPEKFLSKVSLLPQKPKMSITQQIVAKTLAPRSSKSKSKKVVAHPTDPVTLPPVPLDLPSTSKAIIIPVSPDKIPNDNSSTSKASTSQVPSHLPNNLSIVGSSRKAAGYVIRKDGTVQALPVEVPPKKSASSGQPDLIPALYPIQVVNPQSATKRRSVSPESVITLNFPNNKQLKIPESILRHARLQVAREPIRRKQITPNQLYLQPKKNNRALPTRVKKENGSTVPEPSKPVRVLRRLRLKIARKPPSKGGRHLSDYDNDDDEEEDEEDDDNDDEAQTPSTSSNPTSSNVQRESVRKRKPPIKLTDPNIIAIPLTTVKKPPIAKPKVAVRNSKRKPLPMLKLRRLMNISTRKSPPVQPKPVTRSQPKLPLESQVEPTPEHKLNPAMKFNSKPPAKLMPNAEPKIKPVKEQKSKGQTKSTTGTEPITKAQIKETPKVAKASTRYQRRAQAKSQAAQENKEPTRAPSVAPPGPICSDVVLPGVSHQKQAGDPLNGPSKSSTNLDEQLPSRRFRTLSEEIAISALVALTEEVRVYPKSPTPPSVRRSVIQKKKNLRKRRNSDGSRSSSPHQSHEAGRSPSPGKSVRTRKRKCKATINYRCK